MTLLLAQVLVTFSHQPTEVLEMLARKVPRGLSIYATEARNSSGATVVVYGSGIRQCAVQNGLPLVDERAVEPTLNRVRTGGWIAWLRHGRDAGAVATAILTAVKKSKAGMISGIAAAALGFVDQTIDRESQPIRIEGWIKIGDKYELAPGAGAGGLVLAKYRKRSTKETFSCPLAALAIARDGARIEMPTTPGIFGGIFGGPK